MPGIIGHARILRELRSIAATDPPAHALLLCGPVGTGRTLLAREYARLLNCEERDGPPAEVPCGSCRACRLVAEGTHPDVLVLAPGDSFCRPRPDEAHDSHPESRDIRICQVRGMTELAARFPLEAAYRVVIVEPADMVYREAFPAMLKTLEEPPSRTLFVLVSGAPEVLPETIASRCRRIEVGLVSRDELEAGLVARGVAPELAAVAAAQARGRPARALAFASQPSLTEDAGRVLERCRAIAAAGLGERFAYANELAERWRRDRSLVAGDLEAWEAYWESELVAAARGQGEFEAPQALAALRAVAQAREDLRAMVIARAAFELMLMSFPRATMGTGDGSLAEDGEPAASYA